MNKTDLANRVGEILAETTGVKVTKKGEGLTGDKAVEAVVSAIVEGMQAGQKVSVHGLGTLEVHERAARKGRNPQSGDEIEIAAKKVPKFKAGKALKDAVKA
ncbi:HU family DNA-binding protein [Bacillus sp. Marseille-P3800]|uniref:HU family DNA-binding protein n=1 Tax=Bacillus sp. Marseille-P3800 TaxID=2014782 RepID=UPI000C078439|nr:HU family DNA-binding protein [Bacillus sp. Marseille-P3800]